MRLFLFTIFVTIGLLTKAQQKLIKNFEFYSTLGVSDLYVSKFEVNDNLDFVNYIDFDPEYVDEITVNLGVSFDFLEKISADIELILMSDLAPDNFNISANYNFNKLFSVGFGLVVYRYYVSNFDSFHKQSLPENNLPYFDARQFKAYDLGFYLSPEFKVLNSEKFKITLVFDVGISTFSKNEATFLKKIPYSNERQIYQYHTIHNFQPFIQPELQVKWKLFEMKNNSIGLIYNTNIFYSKRNMEYVRSVQIWTPDNEIKEIFEPDSHDLFRFAMDFGLYFAW